MHMSRSAAWAESWLLGREAAACPSQGPERRTFAPHVPPAAAFHPQLRRWRATSTWTLPPPR
jgi:hypothetical protein